MPLDLEGALVKLGKAFSGLGWDFRKQTGDPSPEIVSYWPGDPNEDVMVCVLKDGQINEPFHRQDFFFFNYAYKGSYSALCMSDQNLITVRENECYIGQPYNGYALKGTVRNGEIIIIGILIHRETFLHDYLSTISYDSSMLQFFLEPQSNPLSEHYIRLSFDNDPSVKHLLELIVAEYAQKQEDTQQVLRPLVLALFMRIARAWRRKNSFVNESSVARQMEFYIKSHIHDVTLKNLSEQFSYHPNYVSSFLKESTGKSFSEILLAERMKRAGILLNRTSLSIEEIACISGYRDSRNFYKAFRKYYGISPREYAS